MDSEHSKIADEKDVGHASVDQTYISEKEVTEEARLATSKEHNLSVRQGIKAYKKAIGWSILLSSAVIMEGYDTILVGLTSHHASTSALTSRLDLIWGSDRSTTLLVIRLLMASPRSLHHGRVQVCNMIFISTDRHSLEWSVHWRDHWSTTHRLPGRLVRQQESHDWCYRPHDRIRESASDETADVKIFISFFGKTLPIQLVGQILCGIPWGVYQTVTTVYASEVLPVNLRGYLTR
jgi:SP family general alpha glucoside:H+ symporter-like MFS transporter